MFWKSLFILYQIEKNPQKCLYEGQPGEIINTLQEKVHKCVCLKYNNQENKALNSRWYYSDVLPAQSAT